MLLVVGGNSRKIGKSSVVEGIIRTLPEAHWTALKITKHSNGNKQDAPVCLQEETNPRRNTDSGRYLRAGAARSFWLTASSESLASALPDVLRLARESDNTIVESTSLMDYLNPDLLLMVIDDSIVEWKNSARRHISAADAVVQVSRPSFQAGTVSGQSRTARVFTVTPPVYLSSGLIEWIRNKMKMLAGNLVDYQRPRSVR